MRRREFTLGMALTALAQTALAQTAAAQLSDDASATADEGKPFSFELLTEEARTLAGTAYTAPKPQTSKALSSLSYDQYRLIRFNTERSLWRGEADFELQPYHLGWLFREPVDIFAVKDGKAAPVSYTQDDFIYEKPLEAEQFSGNGMSELAGFRLLYPLNEPNKMDELVSFLGASYFRALGRGSRYGLSARGVAINTATSSDEEFPRFRAFYVDTPNLGDASLTVSALLDGASVTGAYRFFITPGEATQMEVTARLFLRQDLERLGIAPMTSMFLFNGINRGAFDDYRESVHDSEGLKIVAQDGETSWRSLNNPRRLATSFFAAENPKAFGLMQRSRGFPAYQDAGARYELRPSLLVEPLNDWGAGSVGLVEIPTNLEVNDNIVAFWVPKTPAKRGDELEFRYRLTWGSIIETNDIARVVNVAAGAGGVSGVRSDDNTRKFVIDFKGGVLGNLFADANVDAAVIASNGEIVHSTVSSIESTDIWRLVIDIRLPDEKPVELSAYLNQGGVRISETWLIQWRSGDEQRH